MVCHTHNTLFIFSEVTESYETELVNIFERYLIWDLFTSLSSD